MHKDRKELNTWVWLIGIVGENTQFVALMAHCEQLNHNKKKPVLSLIPTINFSGTAA